MENKHKGFTIIEMIIVIAVVAILAVSANVYIGFMKSIKLQAAADKLVADIRYAQSQAMSRTTWMGISFEADPANKYSVYQTDGIDDTLEIDPANFGQNLIVNTNDKFGILIKNINIEGGGSKLAFDGLGAPRNVPYGYPISQESTVVLGVDSQTKTISITPSTGKVTEQ
ncbi:MAG: GspH/FimT family pseudopilin [Candidatus Margulisiibacteriota bacterium]